MSCVKARRSAKSSQTEGDWPKRESKESHCITANSITSQFWSNCFGTLLTFDSVDQSSLCHSFPYFHSICAVFVSKGCPPGRPIFCHWGTTTNIQCRSESSAIPHYWRWIAREQTMSHRNKHKCIHSLRKNSRAMFARSCGMRSPFLDHE
jgi:hypothetical protein